MHTIINSSKTETSVCANNFSAKMNNILLYFVYRATANMRQFLTNKNQKSEAFFLVVIIQNGASIYEMWNPAENHAFFSILHANIFLCVFGFFFLSSKMTRILFGLWKYFTYYYVYIFEMCKHRKSACLRNFLLTGIFLFFCSFENIQKFANSIIWNE